MSDKPSKKAQFQKKRYEDNKGKYNDSQDFARFTLWWVDDDYPSKSCCATGIFNVVINGQEIKMRMYLHKGREGSKSDLYGFVKMDSKTDPQMVFNAFADAGVKQEIIDPEELKDDNDVF